MNKRFIVLLSRSNIQLFGTSARAAAKQKLVQATSARE